MNTGKTTVGSVIEKIQQQTKYKFFYDSAISRTPVNGVKVKNASVNDVLKKVLKDKGISYKMVDNVIYLKHESAPTPVSAPTPFASPSNGAKKAVKGVVLDETGSPVIGATVKIKGTNVAAVTDLDGNFQLEAPEGSQLEVTYLGYGTKVVAAAGEVTVKLTPDEKVLAEVVVTALGIKRSERALSYNVQKVSSDKLTTVKEVNFVNSLNGTVAGVNINASTTGVGGPTRVVMRGTKSITGGNGVP